MGYNSPRPSPLQRPRVVAAPLKDHGARDPLVGGASARGQRPGPGGRHLEKVADLHQAARGEAQAGDWLRELERELE